MSTISLDVPREARSIPGARGETVHIVTWRLFDYDGAALTYGGLQRWLIALVDLLARAGHTVQVHQKANVDFEREFAPGVHVRGHRAVMRARGTPKFNRTVDKAIPAGAPVIYMAEDVSYPRCRERSVVIQHGVWWDGELRAVKARITEHIVRAAVRRSAATVCVDTNFINWFRARWPRADVDHKLHFVPNFLVPEEWGAPPGKPAALSEPDGRLTVCFPRRSEPRRGIMLMADVAPELTRRYPHVDFRFLVGSGNHTEPFRERMRASGVASERWPIDVLPFHRMREAYEHSAIVTIPTICGEGTSLSAIEAMYFGCAIVATWVGGLPNLIQHRHNGLLIAPRPTDLADALSLLIEDRALRGALGERAMADVLPQYGADRWRCRVGEILAHALRLRLEVVA